jgi:flavin-dependent dehydrogenase
MREQYDVVVIGGGPGGSTAAGYLARHGHEVLLLERNEFPRHRIGESLLPSMMPVLEDFDLVETCRQAGFVEKTGATFIWGNTREPWDIRFADTQFLPSSTAFHVERAVFDRILLDHARASGVDVHHHHTALGPIRERDRIVGIECRDNDSEERRSIRAQFVVDASGSASVIGREVTERRYDDQMRQQALYSYFKGVRGPQDFRDRHIIIESCPKGWIWFIPINSRTLGEVSVGLVTGQEFRDEINEKGTKAFFDEALSEAPYMLHVLGPQAERSDRMYTVRDWAYTCAETAGPGYYLVGDAAAFLDPLLSTGVSLAMLAGYSASVCLNSVLRQPSMDAEAARFYADNYRQMYEVTRDFLHYFYSGNATAHPDQLFWKARKLLNLDENIGAKQAFGFFINTIPGNPHPAVSKQIPMFHQFMNNLSHPLDEMRRSPGMQARFEAGLSLRRAERLDDDDVPVVNGRLEKTWTIDRNRHELSRLEGIAFDRDRPVFSSTSSWLLGRNVAALDHDACRLLALIDGTRRWAAIVRDFESDNGTKSDATEVIGPLLEEDFVLVQEPAPTISNG